MILASRNIHWYVLFATHGKAAKVSNYLKRANIEYFFPYYYKERQISNSLRIKTTLRPLITNLVFVKSSIYSLSPHIIEIKERFCIESELYYRDLGSRELIIVPDRQMQSFITIASQKGERIIYLSNDEVNIEKGTKIRIIGGPLEGIEGIFMRIKGDRRVVVTLTNLFSIATAFVPLQHILPLE